MSAATRFACVVLAALMGAALRAFVNGSLPL